VEEHPEVLEDAMREDQAMRTLKLLQREHGFPSYSTFMRARFDKQFADVKKREKHFHCRCPTCAMLQTKLLNACKSSADRETYNKLLKQHHFEVKHWRALETHLQLLARSSPDKVAVLSYDDTSAMGFPRMTNRPIKSMPNDRVYMTPFNLISHGTVENFYIYDLKGKWKKGADRLCTMLYHVIWRMKHKADCTQAEEMQKKCRKLVLMADNCAENKNNCLFAFCAELVARKWFDEIEILFGPVGHTHNGNDAVHFIHNQIAGNFCSITPAELFTNFSHAWHTERTRPQPIIMETQYTWTARYLPYQNRVSGFTNTGIRDPLYVRAFRFGLNAEGICEMHIKGSPVAPVWCGVQSVPDAPGFTVLVCPRPIPSLGARPNSESRRSI
jgi:hypothetical protein